MKSGVLFLCTLIVAFNGFSQSSSTELLRQSLDSVALEAKTQDDAASFIYAYVDAFLAEPTEKRITLLDECEKQLWRPLKINDEFIAYVILKTNTGYYASLFGDISKAIDAYEIAWKTYQDSDLTGFDIIEYCLKPLGNNYSMLGDYRSAENVIKNYLFIAETEGNFSHLLSAFINLSIVYHDTGRQAEAIELLQRSLEIKGNSDLKKGIIYSNLSRNYFDVQNKSESFRCATLALEHLKKSRAKEVPVHLVNTLKILSLLKLSEGNMAEAKALNQKAATIVRQNLLLFKKRELAKLITEYAGMLEAQNQSDLALLSYQQALTLLLPGFEPKNGNDLPDKSLLYAENSIKETLDGLAELYSKKNPTKALQCFNLSFDVEDLLRHTYHYQEDRLQQQVEIRKRTEQCLALLFNLFEENRSQEFILQAFQLTERTKAVVLREAISSNQFVKQDSLLTKQHDLTFKKASLASDLVLEQMKGEAANVERINELHARQTELSIELKVLQKSISQKYPQYKSDDTGLLNINTLQQKLARENATLIEYVSGRNTLFVFIADARSVAFHKIEEGSEVYDRIRTLNDLFASASAINNNIELYKRTAFGLTGLLRIPVTAATKNLVIIPDGLLNYVPFEALLFEEKSTVNYARLPYLTKKFSIAYQSSAITFTDYERSTRESKKNVLGVFPIFRNSARLLIHSQAEAKSIASHADGKFLFDGQATKKAFGENLQRYAIIHLSTHAAAGSWLEPPSIDFIDSTLYLPEVYGLQFRPDLMVLSACETGVGKMLKGEGALSLARGFQYAGANNIVFSLWKVNDHSTARLMSSFYEYYFDGKSKPGALRLAKLDYLENTDVSNARKSPYFWAPFVYYGDIGASVLRTESPVTWFEVLLLILTFLFLIAVFWRIRKRITKKASS